MYPLLTHKEWADSVKECTNRQLLKHYRSIKEIETDLLACKAKGWVLYLGESLSRQLLDIKRGLTHYTKELTARGYDLNKIKLTTKSV